MEGQELQSLKALHVPRKLLGDHLGGEKTSEREICSKMKTRKGRSNGRWRFVGLGDLPEQRNRDQARNHGLVE